jgi:acetyl esterase/lipase
VRPQYCTLILVAATLGCRHDDPATVAAELFWKYRYAFDVPYHRAGTWQGALDVMYPRDTARPKPTVVAVHGGGFVGGSKEAFVPFVLPYVARGWVVVNVGYRLADEAPAPAAVEDVRCVLQWVGRNAAGYGIDPRRIVITGYSAGGYLALIAALLPDSAGFDGACPGQRPTPAAVASWAGIADLPDVIQGSHGSAGPARWVGDRPDRLELAEKLSPLLWVRPGVAPIISVHGDADASVPYEHSVRLHAALTAAGVPNELVGIPRGGHGYTSASARRAMQRVIRFLERHLPSS